MIKDHVTPSNELIETRCDAWQGQLLEKVPKRLPWSLLSLVPNPTFSPKKSLLFGLDVTDTEFF